MAKVFKIKKIGRKQNKTTTTKNQRRKSQRASPRAESTLNRLMRWVTFYLSVVALYEFILLLTASDVSNITKCSYVSAKCFWRWCSSELIPLMSMHNCVESFWLNYRSSSKCFWLWFLVVVFRSVHCIFSSSSSSSYLIMMMVMLLQLLFWLKAPTN